MTSQSDITKQIRQDMNRQKAIVDADPWRLHYHLMPEVGWLNDPNGPFSSMGRITFITNMFQKRQMVGGHIGT